MLRVLREKRDYGKRREDGNLQRRERKIMFEHAEQNIVRFSCIESSYTVDSGVLCQVL